MAAVDDFKEGFVRFGHLITLIVNFLLLSLVYIVAIGPTKAVSLLVGKDFFEQDAKTYWNTLEDQDEESYYKMY